jgi:hypothetical protein
MQDGTLGTVVEQAPRYSSSGQLGGPVTPVSPEWEASFSTNGTSITSDVSGELLWRNTVTGELNEWNFYNFSQFEAEHLGFLF